MKQLRVNLCENSALGSGYYLLLVVRTGKKWAYCLHAPTLTAVQLDARELTATGEEFPISRGLKSRLIEKRRQFRGYNYRLPESLIKEAIESL